jgi:hypothetical protein
VIDEGVSAQFVINCRYLEFSGRQPLQSRRNIARPNLPSRTVFKFDNVTLVMLLNSHEISPGAHTGAPMKGFPGGIGSITMKAAARWPRPRSNSIESDRSLESLV